MTSTLLAHGTIVQLSKSNASSKTTSGQWCVCILDKDSAAPWAEGTFQVFNQKAEAEAYLAVHDEWLLDTTDPMIPPPSPERMDGFVASLARKKADLHHLTSNWTEWCTSSSTPPPPSIDPYVGRHVQILVKTGDCRSAVTALIESKDGDVYRMTYVDTDGDEVEISMMVSALKDWVKRRPDALQDKRSPAGTSSGAGSAPTIGYPIKVIIADLPCAFDIIKKLTVSANLDADTLDAHEALAVLVARHGARATTDYAKVVLTHPGADADDAPGGPVDIIIDGLFALNRELANLGNDPARPRLWPSDSSKKLGEAIASAFARTAFVLPPQHPLSAALKLKAASSAEWIIFLGDQWMITVDQPRHVFAQSKRNDDYIMTGMLEHFLRASGVTIASIASYADQLNAGGLLLIVSELASPRPPPMQASLQLNPLQNQQYLQIQQYPQNQQYQNPVLTPFQQQLGLGAQHGLQVLVSDKKTADSSRDVLQLRADAQALLHDPIGAGELENLIKIKASGDGKLLEDGVKAVTSPGLKRLIASDGDDLSKHLQGALSQLAMHIDSIRCKLEDRMQAAVTGGATASLTQRQKLAIRHARVGHLKRLHLFHLIDEDDSGTKEAPLAQLGKWSKDKQKACLALALRQLEVILQFSNPHMIGEIMTFFTRLLARLTYLIEVDVKHADLSKWYAHILDEVTKPLVKFANGDTNSGALVFDVTLLGAARDHEDALRIAESTAIAAASMGGKSQPASSAGVKKPGQKKDQPEGQPDGKKPKADDHPLKNVWADSTEELVKIQGKYVKRVKADHPLMQQWFKDNPKKDGKGACWMHFNLKGGCVFGTACKNSHAGHAK